MCHPWLAAGVTGLLAFLVVQELASLTREPVVAETDATHGLLGLRLRRWFRARVAALVDLALASGLTANHATSLQLAMSVLCGMAYGHGWMFTAGWLLIGSGTLDVLDGDMARRQGRDGPRGAFLDSVVDRYGESVVFAGLAAFYREDWLLWGVLSAWMGSFLVSYARARAESLGIACRDGMLQRPERYLLLGGTSMIGTMASHLTCARDLQHGVMATAICVLAVLANVTALQRVATALRSLK